MKRSTKFVLAQLPASSFAIWFVGWIFYIEANVWHAVKPPLFQNILGLLMIVYVFASLEVAKRLDRREYRSAESSMPTVCPSCHGELTIKTQVAPFRVTYTCKNAKCGLAPKKRTKRRS